MCVVCRVTWVIMVPTVLPFFLDACEADSSACGTLTHLCCSGEAYPKYALAFVHCIVRGPFLLTKLWLLIATLSQSMLWLIKVGAEVTNASSLAMDSFCVVASCVQAYIYPHASCVANLRSFAQIAAHASWNQ